MRLSAKTVPLHYLEPVTLVSAMPYSLTFILVGLGHHSSRPSPIHSTFVFLPSARVLEVPFSFCQSLSTKWRLSHVRVRPVPSTQLTLGALLK